MIPRPILLHQLNPTLKRRFSNLQFYRIMSMLADCSKLKFKSSTKLFDEMLLQDIEPVCLDDLCNIEPIVKSSAKPQSGITGLKLNADLGRKSRVKPRDPNVFYLLGEVKYEFKACKGILHMARSVRNNRAIAREQSARSARKNGAIAREESTGSSRKNGAITREESDGSARNNGAIAREELVRVLKIMELFQEKSRLELLEIMEQLQEKSLEQVKVVAHELDHFIVEGRETLMMKTLEDPSRLQLFEIIHMRSNGQAANETTLEALMKFKRITIEVGEGCLQMFGDEMFIEVAYS
ncbi:hypothetical protein CFP56_026576 [Quercus suber]|uniref:Uncharacterized protein n=1 Tax=Quercus suber TaxID=58331 RepID=A0AAW0K0I0_QUESU